MAHRVAQVQHRPAAAVALVGGDDLELGARAGEDHVAELGRIELLERPHPLPQLPAGDQGRLHHLDEARRQLLRPAGVPSVAVSAITALGRW